MIDEARILVGEAVVILPPDMRGQQVIQRRDRLAPGDRLADLEPFGVLVEHRIDDVDEGLVAGEKAMAAGQQISFQPALAQMLAQHLHDPAVGAEIDVDIFDLGHPLLAGDFVDGLQPVRGGLVRSEQPEILLVEIELHHVAQESSENARRFRLDAAGFGHRHGIVVEVRHRQRLQQFAAIGVRIGAHAAMAGRRERGEFLAEFAAFVEQFLRPVAPHPVFELLQMFGVLEVRDRHLMRAPGAFDRQAVDEFRPRPALGRAKHDHRPAGALQPFPDEDRAALLDLANLRQDRIERAGESFDARPRDRRPRRNAAHSHSRGAARSVPRG